MEQQITCVTLHTSRAYFIGSTVNPANAKDQVLLFFISIYQDQAPCVTT